METISVSDFKAKCLSLFEEIERTGRAVVVTKRGRPIAQVLPPPSVAPAGRRFGCMAGTAEEIHDILEPWPPEVFGRLAPKAAEPEHGD